jgi:hypothetical protein
MINICGKYIGKSSIFLNVHFLELHIKISNSILVLLWVYITQQTETFPLFWLSVFENMNF